MEKERIQLQKQELNNASSYSEKALSAMQADLKDARIHSSGNLTKLLIFLFLIAILLAGFLGFAIWMNHVDLVEKIIIFLVGLGGGGGTGYGLGKKAGPSSKDSTETPDAMS